MSTDTSIMVAMALLREVESGVHDRLGNVMAVPWGTEYDPKLDRFCKEAVKQCDLAEQKAPDSEEVELQSNILKAQIYGCWVVMGPSQRGVHHKAVAAYDRALALGGDEAELRYRMALLYRTHSNKQEAIRNFERVVEIAGTDSELGIECAKERKKRNRRRVVLWPLPAMDRTVLRKSCSFGGSVMRFCLTQSSDRRSLNATMQFRHQ
jgi:tetratricopeptide (TPR) repeat protein